MFPELQQQAAQEVEAARRRSRASSRRGGRLASTTSAAPSASTFALSTTRRPGTPPLSRSSSSASLLLDTARTVPTRRKTPRRRHRSRRNRAPEIPSQSPSPSTSLSRSRALSSSSFTTGRIGNAVPPLQFLARSAGSVVDETRNTSMSASLAAHNHHPNDFPVRTAETSAERPSISFRSSFDFSPRRQSTLSQKSPGVLVQTEAQQLLAGSRAPSQARLRESSLRAYQTNQLTSAVAQLQSLLSNNPAIPAIAFQPPTKARSARHSFSAISSGSSKKSRPSTADPAIQNYSSSQVAVASAQLQALLSAGTNIPLPAITSPIVDAIIQQSSSSSQDGSKKSRHSPETPVSVSTKASDASSFTNVLVRRAKDRRLLRNSTKPPLHQRKRSVQGVPSAKPSSPASLPVPVIVDSPSMIDSPHAGIHIPTLPPGFSSLHLPTNCVRTPGRKAVLRYPTAEERLKSRPAVSARHLDSSSMQNPATRRSDSSPIRESPATKGTASAVGQTTPRLQFSTQTPRRVRLSAESGSSNPIANAVSHRTSSVTRSRHIERQRIGRDSTSPTGSASTFHSRSFTRGQRHSTRSSEDFDAEETPLQKAKSKKFGNEDIASPSLLRRRHSRTINLPRLSSRPVLPGRGQSGMCSFFRTTAFKDDVFGSPLTAAPSTTSSKGQTPTPEITVSFHGDQRGMRRATISKMTSVPLPPYFAQGGSHHHESTNTSSPYSQISPGATLGSGVEKDRIKNRAFSRSSSDQLSPFTSPWYPPRRRTGQRHKNRWGSFPDEFNSMEHIRESVGSYSKAVEFSLANRHDSVTDLDEDLAQTPPAPRHKSSKRRFTIDLTSRQLPRLRTSVSAVMMSLRGRSAKDTTRTDQTSNGNARKESARFLQKLSISSFSIRKSLSLDSLRRGRSKFLPFPSSENMAGNATRRQFMSEKLLIAQNRRSIAKIGGVSSAAPAQRLVTAADLVVTGFHQTPFAQRHHDTRRAEQQNIDKLVEEAMQLPTALSDKGTDDAPEDEDTDDIVLGYERNVPDHLPTSPLCPLHPKHPSGGKAICPQHGRYRKRRRLPEATKKPLTPARSIAQISHRQARPSPNIRAPGTSVASVHPGRRRSISSLRGESAKSYKIPQLLTPAELLSASRSTADFSTATDQVPIAPVAKNATIPTSGTLPTQPRPSTPPPAPAPPRKPRHRVKIVFDSRDMPPEQASRLSHHAPQNTWPRRPSVAVAVPSVTEAIFPPTVSPPDFMGLEGFVAQRVAPPSGRMKFDGLGGDAWEDW